MSHDRYFINQTATRILELTNQAMVNYIGNYDYYLEKKEELTQIYAPKEEEAVADVSASATKLDWKQQKEEQARLRKRENDLKKTEAEIEKLETRDGEIDEEMAQPEVAVNVAECVRLSKEKGSNCRKTGRTVCKMGGTGVNYEKHALRVSHGYRGLYTPFRSLLNKRHWRLATPRSRTSTDFGSLLT